MANNKAELILQLLDIAQDFDNKNDKENKGQMIRDLIQDLNTGQRDFTQIKINARMTLDKYDGVKTRGDGKDPIESKEYLTEF